MNSNNPVRSFLAAMGANINGYEKSFTDGNNSFGNRATTNNIENADNLIRRHFGMNQPISEPSISYTSPPLNPFESQIESTVAYNSYNNMQANKPSREERLNKLLGKSITPVVQEKSFSENEELIKSIQKSLEPVLEQLEDIAVLNGLLVQRIEQLISIVNEEPQSVESYNNINDSFRDENISDEPMEVYNPEVSMSVIDDIKEDIQEQTKKKRKKTS